MKSNRISLVIGISILAMFILFSIFPSFFSPYGLKDMDISYQRPSKAHILGTNDIGYDILTEVIYATRNTLSIGFISALLSLAIGVFIGVLAGFSSSFNGDIARGSIDVFIMLPALPLAVVLVAFFSSFHLGAIMAIALLNWSSTARIVRMRTMQLKQSQFIEGLIAVGISRMRILFLHIIPNLYDVILSRYVLSVANAIMLEATLGFLGMGSAVDVTWGRMMNIAYREGAFLKGSYCWLFAPGVCIALVIASFYSIDRYFEDCFSRVRGTVSYLD